MKDYLTIKLQSAKWVGRVEDIEKGEKNKEEEKCVNKEEKMNQKLEDSVLKMNGEVEQKMNKK